MLANQRETVAVFWTGGWDSSYRVIELSRMNVNIQPVYILDESRRSHSRELNSIKVITEMLKQRQETIADFLPIDIINVSDIPDNEEITNAWMKLKDEFNYGIQHDWTARVAYYKYPMIEMCIEKITKGYMPTRQVINKYGKTKKYERGG